MSKLGIDYEKLTHNLVEAFDELDSWRFPKQMRLRMPYCGIASTALTSFLSHEGFSARSVLSMPEYGVDAGMDHVFTVVDLEGESVAVDATYSQFLTYFGVGVLAEDEVYYPESAIIEFLARESNQPADILLAAGRDFQARGLSVVGRRAPLADVDDVHARTVLESIWSPDNLEEYNPSSTVRMMGEEITRRLVAGIV